MTLCPRRTAPLLLRILVALLATSAPLAAQSPDTLSLPAVLEATRARDPREAQLALEGARAELRMQNIGAERLPSLRFAAQGQYQSDVTSVGGTLPGGEPLPITAPARDTWDARLDARLLLLDPALSRRRATEAAHLAETEARIESVLYSLRAEAIEAFFAAALMQMRTDAIATSVSDLEAQLRMAEARVKEGTSLRSDAASLRAELLRRRQDAAEAAADRVAALRVLAALTGTPLGDGTFVAIHEPAADPLPEPDPAGRPELRLYARTRERLRVQERALAAADLPRLSAFGRVGYGRPGLNMLGGRFDSWWLSGVQLEWAPRLWGAERRELALFRLQSEVVSTEEEAFAAAVRRSVERDRSAIERLAAALAGDDEIVRLREEVERETRLRFEEGVVTSAEYLDRSNDVLAARIARATHRAELGRARARYFNALGLEVR